MRKIILKQIIQNIMHCDDKRTIAALKQYIIDATKELQELNSQIAKQDQKSVIQERIRYLHKAIADSKEQLSEIE